MSHNVQSSAATHPTFPLLSPASMQPVPATEERVPEVYKQQSAILYSRAERLKGFYKEHIESSHMSILDGCKDMKGHVLIVGIGNGTDIPLEKLCMQFDKVTIQDIVGEAMERAIKNLPGHLKGKVEIIEGDLTGCVADLTTFLSTHDKLPLPQFMESVSLFLHSLTPKRLDALPTRSFDYVVSSLVASELYMIMQLVIIDFIQKTYNCPFESCPNFEAYTAAFSAFCGRSYRNHFQDLSTWVKTSGYVYYSDTIRQQNLVRKAPDATPEYLGEPIEKVTKESLDGLDFFENESKRYQEWGWYAFPPDKCPGAMGTLFQVVSLVLKPKVSDSK